MKDISVTRRNISVTFSYDFACILQLPLTLKKIGNVFADFTKHEIVHFLPFVTAIFSFSSCYWFCAISLVIQFNLLPLHNIKKGKYTKLKYVRQRGRKYNSIIWKSTHREIIVLAFDQR